MLWNSRGRLLNVTSRSVLKWSCLSSGSILWQESGVVAGKVTATVSSRLGVTILGWLRVVVENNVVDLQFLRDNLRLVGGLQVCPLLSHVRWVGNFWGWQRNEQELVLTLVVRRQGLRQTLQNDGHLQGGARLNNTRVRSNTVQFWSSSLNLECQWGIGGVSDLQVLS